MKNFLEKNKNKTIQNIGTKLKNNLKIVVVLSMILLFMVLSCNFNKYNSMDKFLAMIICLMPLIFYKDDSIILSVHLMYGFMVICLPLLTNNFSLLILCLILGLLYKYSDTIFKRCYFTYLQLKNKEKIVMYQNINIYIWFHYATFILYYKLLGFKLHPVINTGNYILAFGIFIIYLREILNALNIINLDKWDSNLNVPLTKFKRKTSESN